MVLGSAMSSVWTLINSLQIINYSAIMTLYYPKIVIVLLKFISIANMDIEWFNKAYYMHFDSSKFDDRDSWDYRFKNQGVGSTNILMNCADIFFVIILMLIYFVAIKGISKFIRMPTKK